MPELDYDSIENVDEDDLNKQLVDLGLDPNDSTMLLEILTETERQQLDELAAQEPSDVSFVAKDVAVSPNMVGDCGDTEKLEGLTVWWATLFGRIRDLSESVEYPDLKNLMEASSKLSLIQPNPSVSMNLVNILTGYAVSVREDLAPHLSHIETLVSCSTALLAHQSFSDAPVAAVHVLQQYNCSNSQKSRRINKSEIFDDVILFLTECSYDANTPLWLYAVADIYNVAVTKSQQKDVAKDEKRTLKKIFQRLLYFGQVGQKFDLSLGQLVKDIAIEKLSSL